MRAWILMSVVALAAAGAFAQTLADFEDGVNPLSAGTIVVDPEDPGNHVLFVATGETALLTLAEPIAPGYGIAMRVNDQGLSAMDDLTDPENPVAAEDSSGSTQYGWNLGVSGLYNWGAFLTNRSFISANSGYCWTGNFYADWPQGLGGGLYSMYWFGGPRQVGEGGLSIIGSGTIDNPESPGDGAWSTWSFGLIEGGNVVCANDGIAFSDDHVAGGTDNLPGNGGPVPPPGEQSFDEVYVCGGRVHATAGLMGDVWIDDVHVVEVIAPVLLRADFNHDGVVNLDDFVILKNEFGSHALYRYQFRRVP